MPQMYVKVPYFAEGKGIFRLYDPHLVACFGGGDHIFANMGVGGLGVGFT